jgi:hypothetical protein
MREEVRDARADQQAAQDQVDPSVMIERRCEMPGTINRPRKIKG